MNSPPSPTDSRSSRYIERSRLVACRECRRSKIRCSRTFPCDACTRRGCTDICPDGIKETKRSKSDESLLQENARLVRRIRQLEGILSSLKYPAALLESPTSTPSNDSASPSAESQSSEKSPSSQVPDVSEDSHMSDAGPMQAFDHETDSEQSFFAELAEFAARPANSSGSSQTHESLDINRRLAHASGTSPPVTKGQILAPGCQFTLRALLELYRACGVIERRGDIERNGTTSETAASGSYASNFSSTPPVSSSLPSGSSSVPNAPLSRSGFDSNTDSFDADREVWSIADGELAASLSSSPSSFTSGIPAPKFPGGRGRSPTLELPDAQFDSSRLSSENSSSAEHHEDDLMSFDACQRLLLDMGIIHGSRDLQGFDPFI